ncbi:MAG: sulfotransferase family protein [Deltaproteobacteria bacterium]|nr:sulfotransferase family protein [Deltaproteobacteria bacterium]
MLLVTGRALFGPFRGPSILGPEILQQPFRPLPIRAMNAVGRGLARLGIEPIALDSETLLRMAEDRTGLSDLADGAIRSAFDRLMLSIEEDARLTLFGRYFARRQVLELLTHSLQLVDYRKRHPEIADEVIQRPLFILGLPRTGTTLLYGLLAEDPANRAPLSWEIDDPCPPAETVTYLNDPRIERTRRRFEQVDRLAPGFMTIHPFGALMPQECIVPMASAFMSIRFQMCFAVEGYDEWLLEQDMRPAYEHHRRFLQHMQSRHKGDRWILKSPGHLGPIDTLFDIYPDAQVVQTHRDPIRVIPSVANLEYTMRIVASDDVDPVRLGQQMMRVWSRLLEQGMETRAQHPERESQILDLSMREVVSDPIGCVENIYGYFGIELSGEARKRMQRHLELHPRDEFGIHRYSLDAFGLDQEAVNAAFKTYRDRFRVESEPFKEG